MSEVSLAAIRAACYKSENGNWVPSDSGLSRVDVMENKQNATYRIVGICTKTNQNSLNVPINSEVTFIPQSQQFGQLQDSQGVYGLNFATSEELEKFSNAINQAKSAPTANKRLSQSIPKRVANPAPLQPSNIKNKQLRDARDDILKTVKSEMDSFCGEILELIRNKN